MTKASALSILPLLVACAAASPERKELKDGSYELSCSGPLSRCLGEFESACTDYGYDVLRAREIRERYGPVEMQGEYTKSEARVRCRRPHAFVGGEESTGGAAGPSKACFPGKTQACLGPGACAGAQICLPHGRSFGACDCGEPKPPATTVAPPATETWSAPDGGVQVDDAGAPPSDAGP